MALEAVPDLSFITNALHWFSIGTEGDVAIIILSVLCAFSISRNTRKARILFFPILLGWNAVGLYPGMLPMILGGIIYLHAVLSSDVLAELLKGMVTRITSAESPMASARKTASAKKLKIEAEASAGLPVLSAKRRAAGKKAEALLSDEDIYEFMGGKK